MPGGTGQQPSLFATRPLPEQSPAAAYARSAEQQQQAPAPANYAPTQTAAYGQPAYAVNPPQAAPAPKPKARKTATMTATMPATVAMPAMPAKMTAQMPAMPAPNSSWQAALPVSPWSAYERKSGPVTGLETETVLRSDLKSLKRSRTRAWLAFAGVILVAGGVIHFGLRTMEKNATNFRQLRQSHEALKAQLGGGAAAGYGEPSRPMRQGSRPLPVAAPSVAAVVPPPRPVPPPELPRPWPRSSSGSSWGTPSASRPAASA